VFPIPGTRYNRPETQVTFRGVRPDQIGSVAVRGSRSGLHSGRVLPDSDCDGGSFLPAKPFVEGESVTVRTRLNVLGGRNGHFSFRIADALPLAKRVALPVATPPRVMSFRSRPDLTPAAVSVIEDSRQASSDDIFVAPQNARSRTGR
jgi:hypothetical protein